MNELPPLEIPQSADRRQLLTASLDPFIDELRTDRYSRTLGAEPEKFIKD